MAFLLFVVLVVVVVVLLLLLLLQDIRPRGNFVLATEPLIARFGRVSGPRSLGLFFFIVTDKRRAPGALLEVYSRCHIYCCNMVPSV